MHAQKLTLSETKAILAHDLRRNKTYSNKDIDLSKKDDNIIFTENHYKFINKHIDDNNIYVYGRHKRDDINYAISIVLHYPEDCKIPETLFFKMANKIFENKYGKDNVICSVVHKDEMRSHLHFVFMPIVKDKKKDRLKLCAKDVINRDTLKMLHTEIEEEFKKIYSKGVKLQNEEKGQFKNIEHIEDYKKFKDLEKEYNKIKQDIEPLQTQKQELEIDNYILTNQVEQLKKDIDKNYNEAIKNYQKQKDKELEQAKKDIDENNNNELSFYKKHKNEELQKEYQRIDNKYTEYAEGYKKQRNEELQKEYQRINNKFDEYAEAYKKQKNEELQKEYKKQLKELGLDGHDIINTNNIAR